jgi:hypothetical protein
MNKLYPFQSPKFNMSKVTSPSPQVKKILDQVSDAIRLKHYSYRTEQTYRESIKRYILFHNKRHPIEMGPTEIQAFLSHPATEKNVAASTHTCPGAAGARVECLRLRVKDLGFGNHQIIIRDGKGEDDRLTVLPESLILDLQQHLRTINLIHQKGLKAGSPSEASLAPNPLPCPL